MDIDVERRMRSRAHLLTAPAPDIAAAARHMAATQAQEFWAARWALGIRSAGSPTLADVDAAFERGEIVRTWTMRGTLHVAAPEDVGWILALTAERQMRQGATVFRGLGLDGEVFARAERVLRAALGTGGRLTRSEVADVLAGAGIDPGGMRGNHVLSALCVLGVLVLGPVVPREGAAARDQYVLLLEDAVTDAAAPADPAAELAVRYVVGHGPATVEDFRWWSGLGIRWARDAFAAAAGRIQEVDEGMYDVPRPAPAPPLDDAVRALPPWDEFYLSYADRARVADPDRLEAIGPTRNGLVRPVLVHRGRVIGTWRHSTAVGAAPPSAETFAPDEDPDAVAAALARFRDFWGP